MASLKWSSVKKWGGLLLLCLFVLFVINLIWNVFRPENELVALLPEDCLSFVIVRDFLTTAQRFRQSDDYEKFVNSKTFNKLVSDERINEISKELEELPLGKKADSIIGFLAAFLGNEAVFATRKRSVGEGYSGIFLSHGGFFTRIFTRILFFVSRHIELPENVEWGEVQGHQALIIHNATRQQDAYILLKRKILIIVNDEEFLSLVLSNFDPVSANRITRRQDFNRLSKNLNIDSGIEACLYDYSRLLEVLHYPPESLNTILEGTYCSLIYEDDFYMRFRIMQTWPFPGKELLLNSRLNWDFSHIPIDWLGVGTYPLSAWYYLIEVFPQYRFFKELPSFQKLPDIVEEECLIALPTLLPWWELVIGYHLQADVDVHQFLQDAAIELASVMQANSRVVQTSIDFTMKSAKGHEYYSSVLGPYQLCYLIIDRELYLSFSENRILQIIDILDGEVKNFTQHPEYERIRRNMLKQMTFSMIINLPDTVNSLIEVIESQQTELVTFPLKSEILDDIKLFPLWGGQIAFSGKSLEGWASLEIN